MDFDEGLDRKDTNSVKWDRLKEYFGREDMLPMWVADSDWRTCEAVIEALKDKIEQGAFGYEIPGKKHDDAVVDWLRRRYHWDVDPEWIVYTNGITPGLSVSVRTFADLGDGVVLQPPVYYPFFSVIENAGTKVIKNQLKYESNENTYEIDFEDLKDKFGSDEPVIGRGNRSRMMILCSPHNPVGRVWSEDELMRIGEIALENDILVVSDEIFADYVYTGEHTPFSSLSDDIAHNSITMLAPTKTFNIAGLNIGIAVIPDWTLRERFENSRDRLIKQGNSFGLAALKAAYEEGDEWVEDQLRYLKENKNYAVDFVDKKIPKVGVVEPEGTFLLWMDFTALGKNPQELDEMITEDAEVALDNGAWFGEAGEGFMRLNFACPRSTLKEGLTRIRDAVQEEV